MITATIVRGRKTNRVRVGNRVKPKRKQDPSPQRALRRFRKDPLTRGLDYTVISISLPVGELDAMDAACERAQMARSHFLRQAARFFAEHVLHGTSGNQERMWREALK